MSIRRDILTAAVRDAETAPAPLSPRCWTWTVRDDGLELRLPSRLVGHDDPETRRVLLGCGVALHHACVSLAAAGVTVAVRRLPRSGDGRLVARIWPVDQQPPGAGDRRLHRAIRAAANETAPGLPCPEKTAEDIVLATVATGAHPYRLPPEHLGLVTATEEPGLVFVLHGDSDSRYDWLRAGKALSAAILTAAADGLTTETIDLTPVAASLRNIVPGGGYPYVGLRCRVAVDHDLRVADLVRP